MKFLKNIGKRLERPRTTQEIFQRDPEAVARWKGLLSVLDKYYRVDVRGAEVIPKGAALLVGNHSGGLYTPEVYVLMGWWIKTFGPERPIYILAHDILFHIPIFGKMLPRLGVLPACLKNAKHALKKDSPVLVYPGGDYEAFRPYWQRTRVDFGGRKGFIRLALQLGVPIVPVVTHGSHDTTFVLSRGERIASWLGLARIRSKIFPIVLGLPWGIAPGFLPVFPWPARITIQHLPVIDWSNLGPAAANDQTIIDRCYDEIIATMQAALTRLAQECPHPLFS